MCVLGRVLPVGGTRPGTNGPMAITHCDKFKEQMSGLQVNVSSANLADSEVVPSSGGHQLLLDTNVLAAESQLVKALKDLNKAVAGRQLSLVK